VKTSNHTKKLNVEVKKLALCMPESHMGGMDLHLHTFLIFGQDRGELSVSRSPAGTLTYNGA